MAAQSPLRCSPLHSSAIPSIRRAERRRLIVHFTSDFKSLSGARSGEVVVVRSKVEEKADADVGVENGLDGNVELGHSFFAVRSRRLSLKSLVGKSELWGRISLPSKKVRSIILLNAITIIYASNIPVVKQVEGVIDPQAFTVIRFSLATIPFIPYMLQSRDDTHTRTAGIELGFWVSLGYILQALGLLTSDAGRASFLAMFTVIVVPLIDGLLGSHVPTRTWFGALVSIIGVAMLESSGSPPCIGDLLNFLSAVSFGIHMLRTEHVSRSTKKENMLALLGYEVCVVALLSAVCYFIGGCLNGTIRESNPLNWTIGTSINWLLSFPWIPALYTGIFSTGLCLWTEMAALQDVPARDAAIIYGLEPVWGAGFAWFFLGERWGIKGWIGAALVLAGSLTVQIMGAKSSRACKIDEEESIDFLASDKSKGFASKPIAVDHRKEKYNLRKK